MAQLINLQSLDLSDNRLSREIPSELGHLRKLTSVFLCGTNLLTGEIPEGLRNVNESDLDDLEPLELY